MFQNKNKNSSNLPKKFHDLSSELLNFNPDDLCLPTNQINGNRFTLHFFHEIASGNFNFQFTKFTSSRTRIEF